MEAEPPRPAERAHVQPPQRVRVLLIEDASEDAALIQRALALEHYTAFECLHVDRLQAGLAALARDRPPMDLVLLDLDLPDSAGLATLVTLRAKAPRLPIVVLTGEEDEALDLQALQMGAQDYLIKPSLEIYPNLLARSIRYALERKRAESMKDEFVNMVSHELRTPLTTVREFASILADQIAGPLTQDQQDYLGIINSNLERLGRMIDSLLDVAKIEAGHIQLSKSLVDVQALLDHVLKSLRPLAEPKGIQLLLELPPARPEILADADKLTQILVNLVGNAIKFTPDGGRVTIGLRAHASEVHFSVADTGVGVPADDLPRLFQKFQQFHKPPKGQPQGSGLGLAISKRLIELHGGRIWAESAEGRGSVFTFSLPTYNPDELFHECFRAGIERAKRNQTHFSIILVSMADADDLKARYGVDEASRLMRDVEEQLNQMIRKRAGDLVVQWRYGDVVVVLAEASPAGARAMMERLEAALRGRAFTVGGQPATLSFALAAVTYPQDGTTERELLQAAERRLQREPAPAAVRVLVVDDEPKIRQFLKEVLELRHYEVLAAASGPEALTLLKQERVDLILLDIALPVMSGYEVYHLLREDPATAQIPVIIVTAQAERKDRELGIEGPTYNFIPKPIEVDSLIDKVNQALLQRGS